MKGGERERERERERKKRRRVGEGNDVELLEWTTGHQG